MSETKEERGIFGRVKDAFWASGEAPPAEEDSPAEEVAPPAVPESTVEQVGATDFAAAYAQIIGDGDPKTDQVMSAYVDMASQGMEGPALATAMTSMIRAFGADAGAIAHNVTLRMQAIASAVETQRARMQGRISELETRSATTVAAAEEEIKELQARIATLSEQVTRAKATVQEAQASERGGFAGFERQAAQKTAELKSFSDFMAGTAAKS